jgi:hypothetical protein
MSMPRRGVTILIVALYRRRSTFKLVPETQTLKQTLIQTAGRMTNQCPGIKGVAALRQNAVAKVNATS